MVQTTGVVQWKAKLLGELPAGRADYSSGLAACPRCGHRQQKGSEITYCLGCEEWFVVEVIKPKILEAEWDKETGELTCPLCGTICISEFVGKFAECACGRVIQPIRKLV